jgi:WhiB family redox-sensing transcriptional regulator
MDTSWMVRGRCRDLPPEIFFPSDGVGVEVARRYCAECPVKAPCLEYALENHIEHGVWGGASERERRRIARSRRSIPVRAAEEVPQQATSGERPAQPVRY